MNTFEDGFRTGVETAAKVLDILAGSHAVQIDGEYTWTDQATLVSAAKFVRHIRMDSPTLTTESTAK